MAKVKDFSNGGIGSAMANNESMYEKEPLSEIGKQMQPIKTPQQVLEDRDTFFK